MDKPRHITFTGIMAGVPICGAPRTMAGIHILCVHQLKDKSILCPECLRIYNESEEEA